MHEELLSAVNEKLASGAPGECLDFLSAQFLEQKNYSLLFEARLMKRRLELGLPLIQTEAATGWPADKQRTYEDTVIEVAREVGALFLAEGNIERAWPYYRAIGDTQPVIAAIDKLEPDAEQDLEPIIDIAFQQGAHPAKGLQLILQRYGMCRAITVFGMYGSPSARDKCVDLLVGNLYRELAENLRYAIEKREGAKPESTSVRELITGRDWLFGEYDYYVDTSHLSSVIQYVPDATAVETLRQVHELCEYGMRLSENFRIYGNPPYENTYADFAKYTEAILGINVDEAIAHFRTKVLESEPGETLAAQALVLLLVRLGRLDDALAVSMEHLSHKQAQEITCPTTMQLCRMAGQYGRLMELAGSRGDVLSYAAAAIEKGVCG